MKFYQKKHTLLILAFVLNIFLNYHPELNFKSSYNHWGWNFSLLATILILIIFRNRDPNDWKDKLGIRFSGKDVIIFFATTIILLVVSYFLVDFLAKAKDYSFQPKLFNYKKYFPKALFFPILGEYIYYIPQTFNEEILVGAVLLMGLERNFKKLNKNIIACVVALIFCFMHQALYIWSPYQQGILLTIKTLLCLFIVGVLRNVFILKTRKIVYSWAIHLSFIKNTKIL